MKFDILMEESFSLNFIKENLENIASLACSRDKYFDVKCKIHNIEDFFKTSGFTINKRSNGKFWEDFAELILQKDFKTYKNRFVHFKDWFIRKENVIEIDLSGEEIKKLTSKYSIRKDSILCDLLKQKYEFEPISPEIIGYSGWGYVNLNHTVEKNGIKFYAAPFNGFAFLVPKNEADKKDLGYDGTILPQMVVSISFLEGLLTPAELDEYSRKCYEGQERIEWEIQIGENTYKTYRSVLAKNNITLPTEESQFLRECFITHPNTLDLLGIKKPKSPFPKPFYFIEVKSVTKKFGRPLLTSGQERFIEKTKEMFGILILHIKVDPDKAVVRFLTPV